VDKFLHEWTPRLYRFAMRLTGDSHAAEDLTQETILRAWRQRDTLRDSGASRAWLFRITANLWRDLLRRQRSPVARAGPLVEAPQQCWHSADQVLAGREELQLALQALESLPPRQREVLYLSACEGMKVAEIAKILDISPDAIKASLSLARKKMRDSLKETILNPSASE
jgi:RNA polymerase sigma-70 factor (ECF subfamily)